MRAPSSRTRFLVAEVCLAVAVFGVSAFWGATYWKKSLEAGRAPFFYQEYFEPAVMVACHRGFAVSHPQSTQLKEFLQRHRDRFDCAEISPDAVASSEGLFQGAWRYMLVTVGFAWRWLGISWSGMGPLFGALFGVTIAAAYGIFRLGMNRVVSIAGSGALTFSTLHLMNLPHLRDYSKAPFTLALVLLLGILVKARPRRAVVVAVSAAYGVVLGIGYGFRTDLLSAIPPMFVVLALFVPGGLRKNLGTRLLGTVAFVVSFLICAQPIYSFVYRNGGGQWHVALLGLSRNFDANLGIVRAPYDWGRVYQDEFIVDTVDSYVRRIHPSWPIVHIGTRGYDDNSGAYLLEIVRRFPADVLTRAYASVLKISDAPFAWSNPPLSTLPVLYKVRASALSALSGTGAIVVLLAILAAGAGDLRIGLFLLFVVVYFGGYPAIQFADRHYFHLEFLAWWALGFLVDHGIRRIVTAIRERSDTHAFARAFAGLSWRRAAICAGTSVVVLAVPLAMLRLYQQSQARSLFDSYFKVGRQVVTHTVREDGLVVVPPAGADVALMDIGVEAEKCGEPAEVTARYDPSQAAYDYTTSYVVPTSPGTTHLFVPVYPRTFQGLQFSRAASRCFVSIAWVEAQHLPLLLDATLASDWERSALYQRLPFERTGF